MTHKTKAISYDFRVKAFWALAFVCVLSLGVYIYSVNMAIRNTALRQDLENKVAELSVEQSELEFAYIKKTQGITLELAFEKGYKEVNSARYVSRVPGSALTYNTQ